MNSETIWASHSGLVRQELQGFPIHDHLIGKPVLSQGSIFLRCLSTETHSLPDTLKRTEKNKRYVTSQQRGNVLNDKVTPQTIKEILFVEIFSTFQSQSKYMLACNPNR